MPDLAYYPSRRYAEQNLKPETRLKPYDFASLKIAGDRAVREGVLTRELANYMIPMAMVEGRSQNYGILAETSLYASPANIQRFQKMGLSIYDTTKLTDEEKKNGYPETDAVIVQKGKDKFIELGPDYANDHATSSRLMAAILSSKASLSGVKTAEDAVKRYNGRGRAMEYSDGKYTPADVDVYLKKVQDAKEMLDHPLNAGVRDYLGSMEPQ